MTEREIVNRNQMVNQLLRIGHGDLSIYNDLGLRAAKIEPELFGHLICWNHEKGEVRDSKIAFPVLALRGDRDHELYENAAAHLCLLDPRNLVRAWYYNKTLPTGNGGGKYLKEGIERYIRAREENKTWWDRTAIQHRKSLKQLYALNHIKPSVRAQRILFDKNYPQGSVFAKLKGLRRMDEGKAAEFILKEKIPFLVSVSALGGIKGKTGLIIAIIDQMSGAELITNTQMLQKMGVLEDETLKKAYDRAVERMKKDKKAPSLKAGRAAKAVKDKKVAEALDKIQEDKLETLEGIEGDWLVLGDRSGSMQRSIVAAREVASLIAKQVKGAVHLVFFNDQPTYFNVTGKTLSEIEDLTRRLHASGGTSIGCGLDYIMHKGLIVNGIAICSDGGDNRYPLFHEAYNKYVDSTGMRPTVYLYHLPGGDNNYMERYCETANIPVETFRLDKVDSYALPNLVKTMRTSRYSLVDEIMEMPLLTFDKVFAERRT